MAPRKKYRQKLDLHLNIEKELKEFGDQINLNPTDVLTEGYLFLISEGLKRYGSPDELQERWHKFLDKKNEDDKKAIQREEALKFKAEQSGLQKQIVDGDKSKFINWLYQEFYPQFSTEEIRHYAKLVIDYNDNKVRFALESLKNQYLSRTKTIIPPWSAEESAQVINHLIELGGVSC